MSAASTIILAPNAQSTSKRMKGNSKLKLNKKLETINSRKINQRPRVSKKIDSAFFPFRNPTRKADVPDRNINTGAQKLVIHLVRNKAALALERSLGLYKDASA